MKILVVIPTLGFGGAERLIVNILKKINRQEFTVQVCIFNFPMDLATELEKENIVVHNLNLKHRWSFIEAIVKLNKIIKFFKPDILWSHLYFGILYARLLCFFHKNLKNISVLHYHISSDTSHKSLWYSFRNWIFNSTKVLDYSTVAVSQSVKKDYEKFFSWKDIEVIYNAIDFNALNDAIKELNIEQTKAKLGCSKEEFLILLPGRLHESKGHKYLLEALKIIKTKQNNNIKLIFAGAGEQRKQLYEYCVDLELEHEVIFTGNLPQKELFGLMKAVDLVVLPSLFEAFGIALIEAMYLEKPSIVTQIDGLKEISQNRFNTLQVPLKDSEAIANAIIELMSDNLLAKRISENAQKTAMKYDVKSIILEWYKIFNKVKK